MPRAKLSDVSLKQLVAELKKRQARLADLVVRRDELNRQIAELEAFAGLESAAPAAKRRGRPPGRKPGPKAGAGPAAGKTLADYIRAVLAKTTKAMRVLDIQKAVLAAGYPTKAKNVYGMVAAALPKAGVKKVGRGLYALKGAAKAVAAKVAAAAGRLRRKRGKFPQTAEAFILGLLGGKGATTSEINKAWTAAGRAGRADVTLSKMLKAGKVNREKLKEGKGSTYTAA